MAKIKLQRFTGRPVTLEDLERYEVEFKERFDVIQEEVGTDMLVFHQRLIDLDAELSPKYKLVQEVEMPKNVKQFTAMVKEFGSPILVALSASEPSELLLIIDDKPYGE